MIYVLRSSKRAPKESVDKISVLDAIVLLNKLDYVDFKVNRYYVLGADSPEELTQLLSNFVPEYFVKEEQTFDRYLVNEAINKRNRVSSNRARHLSIIRFKEKIEKSIGNGAKISFVFHDIDFDILVIVEDQKLKIKCSYKLEVNNGYVYDVKTSDFVDIQKNNKIIKIVNEVFRKQRYYYRGKDKEI